MSMTHLSSISKDVKLSINYDTKSLNGNLVINNKIYKINGVSNDNLEELSNSDNKETQKNIIDYLFGGINYLI